MTEKDSLQAAFDTMSFTHAAYRRGEETWTAVVKAKEAYDAAWKAWYATQPITTYTAEDAHAMGYGQYRYQGD